MKANKVKFQCPVTLVGGGHLTRAMLDEALALAPSAVAADGAADRLAAWGIMPEAVIGDMDSIARPGDWDGTSTAFVRLAEQDTTDFEKCLYATEAPLYVGAGFLGRRLDHTLGVLHGMLARPEKRVVLIGEDEVATLLPPGRPVTVTVAPGAIVSLFPLLAARGTVSRGLAWPVDGLAMAPGRQIGTSNRADGPAFTVAVDGPGVVLMLERRYLSGLAAAIAAEAPGG